MMRTPSVLSVLMYLFQRHMQKNCILVQAPEQLYTELEDVGFDKDSVNQALSWLTDLNVLQQQSVNMSLSNDSQRIYTEEEKFFIDEEGRDLLAHLEREGILTPPLRELVIHAAMCLDSEELDEPVLKWIVLMVLFNQPNAKESLQKMELLVLDGVNMTVQ